MPTYPGRSSSSRSSGMRLRLLALCGSEQRTCGDPGTKQGACVYSVRITCGDPGTKQGACVYSIRITCGDPGTKQGACIHSIRIPCGDPGTKQGACIYSIGIPCGDPGTRRLDGPDGRAPSACDPPRTCSMLRCAAGHLHGRAVVSTRILGKTTRDAVRNM